MEETTVAKKTRNRKPTNLSYVPKYQTTDGQEFLDKKEALKVQKKLDLLVAFDADPIADGITGEDVLAYVSLHQAEFSALLRAVK
jgi:hypothetical protein